MIKFVKGNFFDYEADIMVNTVNCVGIMGAGAALQFKNKFPEMFEDYAKACSNNEVTIGRGHIWKKDDMFKSLTIINFPTKKHWRNPSEYLYIEKGLEWLYEILIKFPASSVVTLPALGCGHGGLDWSIVKKLILNYFKNLACTILIFEPSSSTQVKETAEVINLLDKKGIKRFVPSDTLYPAKIKGKSSKELFLKGNIQLLTKSNLSIIVSSKPEVREKKALLSFLDELPNINLTFLLGFNNSYEIDIVKIILEKGYKTILVLPYGILNLKVRKDLKELMTPDNVLFTSIAEPTKPWKSYESINALKFRMQISDLTLINSLNFDKLIKFEQDFKSISSNKFYLSYWSEQVDFFSRISANKIGINPRTKRVNTDKIFESSSSGDS